MNLRHNPALAGLVLLLLLSCVTLAQERFAVDYSQGCSGVVPGDMSLSPVPPWTWEFWIMPLDDDGFEHVIESFPDPDMYQIQIVNGYIKLAWIPSGGSAFETYSYRQLGLGVWNHVAFMIAPDYINISLNGKLDTPLTQAIPPLNAAGDLRFNPYTDSHSIFDQCRISDSLVYAADFDPFTAFLPDLRVGNQEISGWEWGIDPGDYGEAWDSTSLYLLIDGAGVTYLDHNFQYAVLQNYEGQIASQDMQLKVWMTDQGTPEDAEALFHDAAITPFFYEEIDSIGNEARLDTGLLFDWCLDYWYDRYYVEITLGKGNDPDEALQVVADFSIAEESHLIDRDLFVVNENTVACWYFDEGHGSNFLDASGNGHDGTLTNPAWIAAEPYQKFVYITSSMIYDGLVQEPGLDPDDYAEVTFSEPLLPVNITSSNIDDVLPLSSGHSWLSGTGEIGSATWNATNDTLTITFDFNGGESNIASGDTIRPNPDYIMSADSLLSGGYRFIRFEVPLAIEPKPGQTLIPDKPTMNVPYPMPFNSQTRIELLLPERQSGSLKVYNTSGRIVGMIFEGYFAAGSTYYSWNAEDLSSGVYFIVLETDRTIQTQKTVLLK